MPLPQLVADLREIGLEQLAYRELIRPFTARDLLPRDKHAVMGAERAVRR